MIETAGLQKRFGPVRAVADVSFTARDGSITGLLGANGAGKTTTLRIIAGALRQESGTIRVDGCSPQDDLPVQRRLGALLDHTGLYARLTVREHLAYFGELYGLSRKQINERIQQLLTTLGMNGVAGRRAGELSQGQRMKVALGRAMIHSPQNLLLDEPTNGLDVPTVRALRTILTQMRDAGMCILFSSHVLEEVQALCDTVVILAHGVSVACGSPAEVCRQTGTSSLEMALLSTTGVTGVEHV
ncbi:MAG: ATP-binding cassette domain-containing protein [Acidobacteriaceae bacterium]|nr:ATP-binding cassette domain-containing protein [Acidobacteriaceae bacterium]MBV9308069.1 ATP-binding cassette domain-containing protein [Acidobacteriaceae bacterium]